MAKAPADPLDPPASSEVLASLAALAKEAKRLMKAQPADEERWEAIVARTWLARAEEDPKAPREIEKLAAAAEGDQQLLLQRLAAHARARRGRVNAAAHGEAHASYEALLTRCPTDPVVWSMLLRCARLNRRKLLQEALDRLPEVVAEDPRVVAERALSLHALGRAQRHVLREAYALQPEGSPYRSELALDLARAHLKSLPESDTVAGLLSKHPEIRDAFAQAAEQANGWTLLFEAFPFDAPVRGVAGALWAEACLRLKQEQELVERTQGATAEAGVDVLYARATALLRLGERERALEALEHAATVRPISARCHALLGRTLVKLGRPQIAVARLDDALSPPHPRTPVLVESLVEAVHASGDHERARTLLRELLASSLSTVVLRARERSTAWYGSPTP